MRSLWTEEENNSMREKYFSCSVNDLISLFPTRSWNAIKIQAAKLGLRKNNINRNCDASNLNAETYEAYYWAGFIAADGSINSNKRLKVTLAAKDEEHLLKLCIFLKTANYCKYNRGKFEYCETKVQHTSEIDKFTNKFNLKPRKTYNPPNLKFLSGNNFLSFLCGFIDGDGCIQKQTGRSDSILTIKGHRSWFDVYSFFEKQLYKEMGIDRYYEKHTVLINNAGYVRITFADRRVLKFLKEKSIALNLPILDRKWSKIDLNLPESRYHL